MILGTMMYRFMTDVYSQYFATILTSKNWLDHMRCMDESRTPKMALYSAQSPVHVTIVDSTQDGIMLSGKTSVSGSFMTSGGKVPTMKHDAT